MTTDDIMALAEGCATPTPLRAAITALVDERDALRQDAERYRWLQERTVATGLSRWMGHHQFLSAAIDAAMKEQTNG